MRAVTPCHARPAGGDRAPTPADFLLRDLLTDRARPIAEARGRLADRLRRAGGLA